MRLGNLHIERLVINMGLFGNKMKRAVRDDMEGKLDDIQLNLENNYRKPAAEAYKIAAAALEGYRSSAEIDDKNYNFYKDYLDEYRGKLIDYL